MRMSLTAAGNPQYGAWPRERAHDDLVLAVALACWAAKGAYPRAPRGEDAYWRAAELRDWDAGLRRWAEGRR